MKMSSKKTQFVNIDWSFYNELPVDEVAELLGIDMDPKMKFRCPCPDHIDKNPSAEINLTSNKWHCWSCGKGGTALNLVMQYEQLSSRDAALFLSEYYPEGVKVIGNIKNEDSEIEVPILDRNFLKEIGIIGNPYVAQHVSGPVNMEEISGKKRGYRNILEKKEFWITYRDATDMLMEKITGYIIEKSKYPEKIFKEFPNFDEDARRVVHQTIADKIAIAQTNLEILREFTQELIKFEKDAEEWQKEIEDEQWQKEIDELLEERYR